MPLLRIYWYHGTASGPSTEHTEIAKIHDVKVRLGLVIRQGRQKGVDALIVTDMLTLARNRAMTECILLSGDEDVRIGVQQAQELGVRVHLLGIEYANKTAQSELLQQEADSTHKWTQDDLKEILKYCPEDDQKQVELSPEAAEVLCKAAQDLVDELSDDDLSEVLRETEREYWPREIHGRMLRYAGQKLGRKLVDKEKDVLRNKYRKCLEKRLEKSENSFLAH